MTYQEKVEALGGDSYDFDDAVDYQPGYFDYDDPRDYEEWCDWNDPDVAEGYYDPFHPDVEGGFAFAGTTFGVGFSRLSRDYRPSMVTLIRDPGSLFRGRRIY